jgi:ketosteroid isomerase-like protein
MHLRRITIGAALLLPLAAGAARAQLVPLPQNNAPEDRQRYHAQIMREAMALLGNWQSAWAQDDPRVVAGFYTPEALVLLPGQDGSAQGSAEVVRALGARLPAMGRVEFQLVDATVGDDMLYLFQRFAVAAQNEASDLSTPPAYAGTSSTVMQRAPGGGWKIRAQVFAPGAAAAGAALLRQGALPAPPPRPTDSLLGALPCTPFEWIPQEGVGEQGAIRIQVELNGRVYQLRLDTGIDGTVLYGDEADQRGWPKQGPSAVRIDRVKLGGVEVGPVRLVTNPTVRPGVVAGAVGLDLLMNHLVVIDYPAKRFCLVPRVAVPSEVNERVQWVAAELRNGKLFVPVRVGGQAVEGLYFDTGASGLPLSVDQSLWRTLTGREGEREATSRLSVAAAGAPVRVVGAPARGALEVGGLKVEAPLVYYQGAEPEHFHGWSFPVAGSLGNTPFKDGVVLLSLGAWPAFGILR